MKKIILLMAVLSLIVVMSSCQKAEEVTVTKYFQAMQHNDKDTMGAMSYEPKDIEFKSYEILSIDEPVVKELELPSLLKKLADIEKKKNDQVMIAVDKGDELAEVEDELEETRRGSKKVELEKKLAELAEQAEAEKAKVKAMQLEMNKINKQIEREKALITLSTDMRDNLEMFIGETQTSKVTVKVTLENDEVKDYIFILRKDTLKLENRQQIGRTVIVSLQTTDEYEKELQAAETQTEEVTEQEPATQDTGAATTEESTEETSTTEENTEESEG
jgi:hypothetical protein